MEDQLFEDSLGLGFDLVLVLVEDVGKNVEGLERKGDVQIDDCYGQFDDQDVQDFIKIFNRIRRIR